MKNESEQKEGKDGKKVVAVGKKPADREALKLVFFAGKKIFGEEKAIRILSLKNRKN